jgi:transcriptional regulator with XRE-family HTH domain
MVDPRTAIAKQFAANVASAQRARKMQSDDLAKRSGLDPAEIDSILRAEVRVGTLEVYLIAGALEVDPAELLAGIRWVSDGEGGGSLEVEGPDGD